MCGVKHAIATSSGTTALHIALLANGVGDGDEVITSPFTFIASINAILFVGAKPVFVDIDPETFNIDVNLIEKAITKRTKAILPVHLYGQVCDMGALLAMAEKHNLKIIEDACQAVMATYMGRYAGSFGTGAFSLYATKNLMCGEGGMITTNDDDVADLCKMIRNHGMKRRYYHEMVGYNFRITDLQSAIGLSQLGRLADMTEKRRHNATFFNERLESVITPKAQEGYGHVWHQYTIRVKEGCDRDEAVKKLTDAGIGAGIYYPVPAHQQEYIVKMLGKVDMPVSEMMAREVISLPVHPLLTQTDLDKIVSEVNKL
jgi:dTDP-4-amino-4,6-dideoxygalactose transaminase